MLPPSTSSLPSPPSSQVSAKSKGKKKQKSPFPTSDAEAKVEFLQTELNAAKARIVQLDASVEDKDRRVSVLMARLKLFEDKQNKDAFDKYFPTESNQHDNKTTPSARSSSTSPQPCQQSSCYPPHASKCSSHCSPPPLCCCHQRTTHCHQNSQTFKSSPCQCKATKEFNLKDIELKEISDKIDTVNLNTEMLKTMMEDKNIKTKSINEHNHNIDEAQTEAITTEQNLDESIASVEELIPDIGDLPGKPSSQQVLNWILPTNQLL